MAYTGAGDKKVEGFSPLFASKRGRLVKGTVARKDNDLNRGRCHYEDGCLAGNRAHRA